MPANPFRVADVLLPLPQTLDSRGYALTLPEAPRPVTVSISANWAKASVLSQGLALLDWRLRQLGSPGLAGKDAGQSETLTIEEVSMDELRDELRTIGA